MSTTSDWNTRYGRGRASGSSTTITEEAPQTQTDSSSEYNKDAFAHNNASLVANRSLPPVNPTERFTIAIICALAVELSAVIEVLDSRPIIVPHNGEDYIYLSANFAGHKALIVRPTKYGMLDTALAVQNLQQKFGKMELTLLVGVCGGVAEPRADGAQSPQSIYLGDVIISKFIVRYMGAARWNPDGVQLRDVIPKDAGNKLQQLLGYLETPYFMEDLMDQSEKKLRELSKKHGHKYRSPGESEDVAFESTYHHLHRTDCPEGTCDESLAKACKMVKETSCAELECDMQRARRRPKYSDAPRRIHVGGYASENNVMRNPEIRDGLVKKHGVLAFEMEAAGVWQLNTASLVIKSVCDYGDSHKHKEWQEYAAACAAATAKAFVSYFYPNGDDSLREEANLNVPMLQEEDWIPEAIEMIQSRQEAYFMRRIFQETCDAMSDDEILGFAHTKSFQDWVHGRTSILVVSTKKQWKGKAPLTRRRSSFRSKLTADEKGVIPDSRESMGCPITACLARYTARTRSECQVLYVDCSWALNQPFEIRHKHIDNVLDREQIQLDSKDRRADPILMSLFLQIFNQNPKQDRVLQKYMEMLEGTILADFQSQMLDTGLPSNLDIPVLINLLFEDMDGKYIIALEHTELLGSHERATAIYDMLSRVGARENISVLLGLSPGAEDVKLRGPYTSIKDDTEYQEFLGSLEFPEMDVRRTQVSPAALETNAWIWHNESYQAFSQQEAGILWVRGKPGSGKSVLARFIRDNLLKLSQEQQGGKGSTFLVGDWFYHQRRGGRYISHASFLRSVLYHFTKQCPEVFHLFCADTYRDMKPGSIAWTHEALEGILLDICRSNRSIICIVDAVDEGENVDVLEFIIRLSDEATSSKARFIILSRHVVAVERLVIGFPTIVLEDENRDDIKKIVDLGLESLPKAIHSLNLSAQVVEPGGSHRIVSRQARRIRQPRFKSMGVAMDLERQALNEIRDSLLAKAQGSILWVKLVLDQLIRQASSHRNCTLEGLRQAAMDVPQELKVYYRQIVEEMTSKKARDEVEDIRRMLMWICAAGEINDITLEGLWEAEAIMKDNLSSSDMDEIWTKRILACTYDELWRKIYLTCGPFIEVYNPGFSAEESRNYHYGPLSVVQLMHQSVRDFLSEKKSAGSLSFTIIEAREFVKEHLENYLDITTTHLRRRHSSVDGTQLVDYLEDRKLLILAMDASKHNSGADWVTAADIRVPSLADPSLGSTEHDLLSALSNHRCPLQDIMDPTLKTRNTSHHVLKAAYGSQLDGILSVNQLFYIACSEGLTTAVLNMLALGWGKNHLYGVVLAASRCRSPRVRVDHDSSGFFPTPTSKPTSDSEKSFLLKGDDVVWRSVPFQVTLRLDVQGRRITLSLCFKEWCNLLDLICGSKRYSLGRQDSMAEDDRENNEIDPLLGEVEEALMAAITD